MTTTQTLKIFTIIKNIIFQGIVAIGVVLYWRGTWYLLDNFSNLNNLLKTGIESLIICIIIILIIIIISLFIPNKLNKIISKLFQYLLIFLFAIVNVAFWRGIWLITDYLLFINNFKLSFICSIIIGLFILGLFQSWSSMLAPPILYISDKDNETYKILLDTAFTLKNIFYNNDDDEKRSDSDNDI